MTGVLGIDPGIAQTGIALLTLSLRREGGVVLCEAKHLLHETIRTQPNRSLEARCLHIFTAVREQLFSHTVTLVAMEEYMIGPYRKTAALVLQAKGAALTACGAAEVPVRMYKPAVIKKIVTGKGNAPKQIVRASVLELLGLRSVSNEHEADALAVAITAIRGLSTHDRARIQASKEAKDEP